MTERELVRCLADAEAGNETALRQWMDNTPNQEVTRKLRNIASRAAQSRNGVWWTPFAVAFYTYVLWANFSQRKPVIILLSLAWMVCMQLWMFFSGFNKWRVRQGRSAVFYLAERGDTQMICPLMIYYARRNRTKNNWTVKVENALIDLLDKAVEGAELLEDQHKLCKMVEAVALKRPLYKAKQDLPAGRAYVTLAATRFLARSGGSNNRSLLHAIVKQAVPDGAKLPHRRLIHDCAVQCIAPPLSLPETVTPTMRANTTTPRLQPTQRS